jgi:hypothetical protein
VEDAYKIVAKDLNDNPYERATGGLMPKKLVLLLISATLIFIILSCDKKNPSAPVDPSVSDLRLALNNMYTDSLNMSVLVSDPQGLEDVDSVWASYQYLRGPASHIVPLHDNGLHGDSAASDGRYSATYMDPSGQFALGYYQVRFYAMDVANHFSQRLDGVFWAVNGNMPVLCDPIGPDSLRRGSLDTSYIYIATHDPNGPADLDTVFFVVTRPDSTSNGFHFNMHDDGQNGDSQAGDGWYTLGILAPAQNNQPGDYKFTFYAVDNENNHSNNPVHIIHVS